LVTTSILQPLDSNQDLPKRMARQLGSASRWPDVPGILIGDVIRSSHVRPRPAQPSGGGCRSCQRAACSEPSGTEGIEEYMCWTCPRRCIASLAGA